MHGGRTVIDIGETVRAHNNLVHSLPAIHCVTGCDSVSQIFRIGKKKPLKVAEKSNQIYTAFLQRPRYLVVYLKILVKRISVPAKLNKLPVVYFATVEICATPRAVIEMK